MAKIRLASPLQFDSIVDGPGVRCVIWTQGCEHNCPNCHNPQTHDKQAGNIEDTDTIVDEIHAAMLQSGLTLSGGEPFLQSMELIPVCVAAKAKGWNIWAYTGFRFEELKNQKDANQLLQYIDVLVDGKFLDSQKDYRLKFKGSKNQRIIDVSASLNDAKIVLSSYDDQNQGLE